MIEAVEVRSRDGLALEAEMDEAPEPRAGLVFCHPHPRMGGTMNAPLLRAVSARLNARGWNVLRFNFRGIGKSEGTNGTGVDEVADALGALDSMAERDLPLAVAGWSFGGAVALRAAARYGGLVGAVAVAPAVRERFGVGAGVPDDLRLEIPVLVVVGTNDDQVSPEDCELFAARQPDATFVKEPGANHFFWSKYDDLTLIIADWLDDRLRERRD